MGRAAAGAKLTKRPNSLHIEVPLDRGKQACCGFRCMTMGCPLLVTAIAWTIVFIEKRSWGALIWLMLSGLGYGVFTVLGTIKILAPYTAEVLHIGHKNYGLWKQRGPVLELDAEEPDAKRATGITCHITSVELITEKEENQADSSRAESPAHIKINGGETPIFFAEELCIEDLQQVHSEIQTFLRVIIGHQQQMVLL